MQSHTQERERERERERVRVIIIDTTKFFIPRDRIVSSGMKYIFIAFGHLLHLHHIERIIMLQVTKTHIYIINMYNVNMKYHGIYSCICVFVRN